MDEKPAEALADKPDASVLVAARLVAEGEADAFVAAETPGPACFLRAQLQADPRRPPRGAGGRLPDATGHGEKKDPFSLILDVGATVDATADDLVAFAVMGAAYARIVARTRARRWRSCPTAPSRRRDRRGWWRPTRSWPSRGVRFVGNVEGVDIPKGTADVIVCDGFVGNVCLKMLEGVPETVVELAEYAYNSPLRWRVGLAMLSSGSGSSRT